MALDLLNVIFYKISILKNFKNTDNQQIKEASDEFIDKEIYAKFLMFLQLLTHFLV